MSNRGVAAGLAALLFLAGCATVPTAPPLLSPSLAAARVFVGSYPYLPSSAVVRELRGQAAWDSDGLVWRLTLGGHELRLAPQMPVALVDGAAATLEAPPVMERGTLLLPEQLWTERMAKWRKVQPPPSAGFSTRVRTIVVDAGHGGHDPGATGRMGLREKTVTLDVAQRLRDLLVRDGFRVVMTRSDDRFIPLYGRTAIANRAEADLFISIHANASRSRTADGFEAYYLSEATDDHARALEAAENADLPDGLGESVPNDAHAILWDLLYTEHRVESSELASYICRGMSGSSLASKSRGIKSARFAVLKGTRMPAVLVEIGFLSHPGEESRMRNPEYRQRIAGGIRRGVLTFRDELQRKYAYAH